MGDHRRRDRIRPPAPIPRHRLRPFHDAPAVVAAALDEVDHLPQFPADIRDPQPSGVVEGHPPRVSQPVRPHLAAGSRHADERVVDGDRIGAGRLVPRGWLGTMVDVDPQHRREEILDRLPRSKRIGRGGVLGVSGGDVEHPVGAKLEAAAVVPPRHPSDDELFASQIDRRRIGGRDGEPGNARPFSELRLEGVDDEALPVFGKAGVEGEAEDMIEPLDRRQIADQIGGGDILVGVAKRDRTHRERKHLPLLLGDHHPIAAGDPHQLRRLVEPKAGENRLVAIRRRRNRGAGDPGARPFGARPGFFGSDRSSQERDESQPAGQGSERRDGAHGVLCG